MVDRQSSGKALAAREAINRRIDPLKELVRRVRRTDQKEQEFVDLTRQVVQKLLEGIAEGGTVSLFHDRQSGDFSSAIFTAYFKSSDLPDLRVSMTRRADKPSEDRLATERRFFGQTSSDLAISAFEHTPDKFGGRGIIIDHRWDMPEGNYDIIYMRDSGSEARNTAIPRSTREKTKFLKQILATEIDIPRIEDHFGKPYLAGDTRSSDTPGIQNDTTHRMYWVRDVVDILPQLMGNSSKQIQS